MEKHLRINISLPKSMNEELVILAEELNEKKSHIIARALSLYFDEMDSRIADGRYKKYLKGEFKTTALEDIEI